MISAVMEQIESEAAALVVGAADRITQGAPGIIADGASTWLDIRATITTRSGPVNNPQISFELTLQATCRQRSPRLAVSLAQFSVEYAIEKILTSGNRYFSSHESTTYEREYNTGAGDVVVSHAANLRFSFRYAISAEGVAGISVQIDASSSPVAATLRDSSLRAYLVQRGALLLLEGGAATVGVVHAGASPAAMAEILDSGDAVVAAAAISGFGKQDFVLSSVGEYRARVTDGLVSVTDDIPVRIAAPPA